MPHYVKMDLNPDIGFKIKDTLSGNSMVMMELNLVNGRSVDEASDTYNGTALDGDMNHETKLIKELVYPWALKGYRLVAEYSYFDFLCASLLYLVKIIKYVFRGKVAHQSAVCKA